MRNVSVWLALLLLFSVLAQAEEGGIRACFTKNLRQHFGIAYEPEKESTLDRWIHALALEPFSVLAGSKKRLTVVSSVALGYFCRKVTGEFEPYSQSWWSTALRNCLVPIPAAQQILDDKLDERKFLRDSYTDFTPGALVSWRSDLTQMVQQGDSKIPWREIHLGDDPLATMSFEDLRDESKAHEAKLKAWNLPGFEGLSNADRKALEPIARDALKKTRDQVQTDGLKMPFYEIVRLWMLNGVTQDPAFKNRSPAEIARLTQALEPDLKFGNEDSFALLGDISKNPKLRSVNESFQHDNQNEMLVTAWETLDHPELYQSKAKKAQEVLPADRQASAARADFPSFSGEATYSGAHGEKLAVHDELDRWRVMLADPRAAQMVQAWKDHKLTDYQTLEKYEELMHQSPGV
jgi:hypothetical protein